MKANVSVESASHVGDYTVAIEFETPEGFDAAPGQFVKLSGAVEGEEYSRFYTISSPRVGDTFEVTVEADPHHGGPFSRHLAEAGAGDEFPMEGPYGSQHYDGERRAVVVTGGVGIGAGLAVAERAVAEGGEAALIYRYEGAPVHEDRLEALRQSAAVTLTDGDVTDAVADALTGADDEQVFVYGFADFVTDARDAVEAAGGDPTAAKVEDFG